jgi:hypothetical protein|tara:strand:- start:193 stop:429 length:237 start_codon:yes stop_codon:yes gene_type:complete
MVMDIHERIARIESTTHIVRIEDSVVYRQNGWELLGDNLFVHTEDRLLFMDLDVMTLEEACSAERMLTKIKKKLNINN